ncbi:MAG: phage scaffolding protein [Lachnospiraceae bacterium]|nr:phage scaffolding protein [Lachnospiraceae bacterium]
MKKVEFIALGITEELAAKAEKASLEELKGYVEKSKHDEVVEENKTLKTSVSDRDKQLETLKASAGDNEELKKQIETMKQQNAEQEKAHKAELAQLRLDNAIENALTVAGAKNSKAVKALLDVSKVKLGEDGKLSGWDDQIKAIQKSDAYLFNMQQKNTFKGFQPGASSDNKPGTNVDMSKMTYEELAAYIESNPDTE